MAVPNGTAIFISEKPLSDPRAYLAEILLDNNI